MLYNDIVDGKTITKEVITKTLVDKIAESINPHHDDGYWFRVLRVSRGNMHYVGLVHGVFDNFMKPYSGWQSRDKFKFAGPESWAEALFSQVIKDVLPLQMNTHSSPVPLYPLRHEEHITGVLADALIEFNTSYLKIEYETS